MGRVVRFRRDVLDANLLQAFPHEDQEWRDRVAVASWQHLVRETILAFRAGRYTPEEVRRVAVVETGLEGFLEDVRQGRGVVMVTGHLGSWEMGGARVAAEGVPVSAVVQVQRNQLFDRELRRTRRALGMSVMSKQEAPRGVLRALRNGAMAGLVADQNVVSGGIFVDFFGKPAATARGPALFALRSGAPLWVGAAFYTGGDEPRYRVRLQRVDVPTTGDLDVDVRAMTEAYTRVLEGWIREAPEQYFWLHKRWKTRPAIPEQPAPGDDIRL
jgi:KDO2-lipid IV(A) lauroyltransferase